MSLRVIVMICISLMMAACQSVTPPPARKEVSTPSAPAIESTASPTTATAPPEPTAMSQPTTTLTATPANTPTAVNTPTITPTGPTPTTRPSIQINLWNNSHQQPVLTTTTSVDNLIATDNQWTEFLYVGRNYPGVFAGYQEHPPLMRFYASVPNGTYTLIANLYHNANLRYYWGYSAATPEQFSFDVTSGPDGDFQEYTLGTVTVSNGLFELYVDRGDLLAGSGNYPFWAWAWIRLVTQAGTPVPTNMPAATPQPATTLTSTPKPAVTALAPTATMSSQTSGDITLALQPVVEGGLVHPTYLTHAGDERLFVLEQPGRIRIIEKGRLLDRPFLDIVDKVTTDGGEQGLLGLAFHPAYKTNGQFFIDYTRQTDGATVIERYTVSKDDPNVADRNSAKQILVIAQPEQNHNGGQLQFGPDGYLYIGMGDGGGRGDQHGSIGNGQDLKALLGKLLRIDATGQDTYAIPPSNPFGNEIWAYGLRNPWRFSFDRSTNDLYIADVGQDLYEEVDFQPASSKGGENYGWRIMEGLHCYDPSEGCDQAALVLPIAEYSHDDGCSITGGYVYRGAAYPAIQGIYFFGDYCSFNIWSLQRDPSGRWQMNKQLNAGHPISSFGEDQAGELYVVEHNGAIYRLTAK